MRGSDVKAIEIYADAIRWWGFMAGVIGLDDIRRRAVTFCRDSRWQSAQRLCTDVCAEVTLCALLAFVGIAVPLIGHFTPMVVSSPFVLATLWTASACVSVAGWAYVVSRAVREPLLLGCAVLALSCCILAAIAAAFTAGGQ